MQHDDTTPQPDKRQKAREATRVSREALRASEEKYRRLFESMRDAYAGVDLQGYILDCNPAFQTMLGYTADELRQMTYCDLTPTQWHADENRILTEQVQSHGYSEVYEKEYRRKDGTVFPVELRTFLLRDAHGHPAGMWAIVRDITERKHAEEALTSSERRFHELAEMAPVGIFLGNARGEVTYVNQRWSDITGWPLAQGLGIDWMVGIHPDDRVVVERGREAMLRERRELLLEYRYLTPDGLLKWITVNACPLLDEHGAMTGFVGTVLDITERKHAEARVQQLLQRVEQWAAEMDATISSIADGVIIYGADAGITRINRAAEIIFGYTPEIEALPFPERLVHLRVESADGAVLTLEEQPPWRALHGETVHGMVLTFTRDDGQRRWISISAAPILSPDGELLGAVATLSDITALHEMQQRQEELLHIVSHDLRTPLAVIHGHMQLLEEALTNQHLDGEISFSTSTIDRNVQRMNAMIQDLVDMARLEGHQFTLALDTIFLQHYVPDLIARMRDVLPMQRVITDLPPDLPPVRADYSRLERILLNLLSNAFKYSAADTPVRLQAIRQEDSLLISVSDQGRGIDPQDLPHVFERFYRAGGARQAEGIGLGLYITNLLVEAHGGHILVESTPGQGSTFAFTLPIAVSEGT